MKRIKNWFLDLMVKYHEAIWNHKRKQEQGAERTKVYSNGLSGIGAPGPFNLQEELARLERKKEALYAQEEFEALEKSFATLFLPAGWGLKLGAVHSVYDPDGQTARVVAGLVRGDTDNTLLLTLFTEGRHAHAGVFDPQAFARNTFHASTANAIVCGRTKEELLLAMICMDKEKEKEHA